MDHAVALVVVSNARRCWAAQQTDLNITMLLIVKVLLTRDVLLDLVDDPLMLLLLDN